MNIVPWVVVGIDPGPVTSTFVVLENGKIVVTGERTLPELLGLGAADLTVIEEFTPHGQPLDVPTRETTRVIDTTKAVREARGWRVVLANRDTVLAHFGAKARKWNPAKECYSAQDTVLRAALTARFGPLKGFKSHHCSALAVAAWGHDTGGNG